MTQAYHPFRNRRPARSHQPQDRDKDYFERAFECLRQHPERVAVIIENLNQYRTQPHLPKSAQGALKRFEYLLSVTHDPNEMARFILEDSYEGRKFRQMPLMLKGVCLPYDADHKRAKQ